VTKGGASSRVGGDVHVSERELERARSTLVGREPEQARLDRFLSALETGATTLVIHGEPGLGKSSLMRWAVSAARERGFATLEAIGIEFECELAFSGLTAVLRPLLGRRTDLGPTQRTALEVAVGMEAGDAPVLTTYAATLDLLSLASADDPVLVAIDDAQWVDRASLEALIFAAHRAGADRVGFLFAQRAGVACMLDRTGFERLELRGLSPTSVGELLAAYDVAPEVAHRCRELTAGNPLALLEGARGLTARQRAGVDPLPPALPVASHLLDTFQERLEGLPRATLHALSLAALETTDDLARVAAALDAAGGSVLDFDPAEQRHLVELSGGQVRWWHPLLRSAVYQQVGGQWRRRSHQALAQAAQGAGEDDLALWHLSETVVGRDADIARRMADLGVSARRRGALMAAAAAHEQAARLSPVPADADRQLLMAGDALWAAGDLAGTADLFKDRIASASTASLRALMAMVLGQAELWTIGSSAGIERFELNAAAVGDSDPAVAAFLLLHASTARLLDLEVDMAVETAARAMALAERSEHTPAVFGAAGMHTMCQLFAGAGAEASDRLGPLRLLLVGALGAGAEGADDLAQLCGFGLLVCERWADATDTLDLVIRSGETTGMMGRSALARLLLAEVMWRTGRWAESLAELSHSLALQEAVRPGQVVPGTIALLARVEASLGQEESCREHINQMLDVPPRIGMFEAMAYSAIGLLELGADRHADAATALDEVAVRVARIGEPGWLWWQGDAIEAYARCGRLDNARQLVEQLEAQAAATGRGWAHATAARGRGTLTRGDEADDHFTDALECYRTITAPFEEARTLLLRGQRRIQAGQRETGARDIASSRTLFDRLGARGWSEQASALRGEASGDDDSLTSRLTPAELRVALAVGRGASNREAADQLFISTKTVDYHLQSIYRKLHLRSRSQLMTLVLSDAGSH
jgi:DNA-binding CsgD family transcriptional regulator